MENNATFAYRLRVERENQHLTQAQLAEKAELSLIMIQKIEAGERFGSKTTHYKLAKALGITEAYLLYGQKPVEKQNKSRIPDLPDDPPLEPELEKFLQEPYGVYFSMPYLSRLSNRQRRQIALLIKSMVEEDEGE